MNEIQIMVTVGEHPNIISLIGACTRSCKYSEVEAQHIRELKHRPPFLSHGR